MRFPLTQDLIPEVMNSFWSVFNQLSIGLGLMFTLLVLSRRKGSPATTWSWILSFFFLPILGPLLYSLVGYSDFKRRKRPKPEPQRKLPETGFLMRSTLGELEPRFLPVSQLAENLSGFPPVGGNRLQFFEGQETIYQALSQAIEGAKKSIFLEYYIFRPDAVGVHFRDLLIQKAQEGLEVKILVDQVGSFSLNTKFLQPLLDSGAQVAFFGALTLKRPWGFQLRNHRKLALIDGVQAFTGSQNICSDFRAWRLLKLDWIDNQVLIEGPSVSQLATVFCEDWEFTTGHKVKSVEDALIANSQVGQSVVQFLPTGPDEPSHAFEKILMALIHAAQHRITLLSPYFIPTESIAISLEAAVRRGVQVEILVPRKSDLWLVDAASKSWYWNLLQGGVSIWETTESFIHAKQVTIDSEVAMIGSANMDERSFRLNFECTTLVFGKSEVVSLEQMFSQRRNHAEAILLSNFKDQTFLVRVKQGLFRLIAPLL